MIGESTRRKFVGGGLAFASAGALIGLGTAMKPARAEEAPDAALGEMALGPEDAPVTVIEFASLTCSHCASFHHNTFPAVKERYIDTGKIRFVFRAIAFDQAALRAEMLARCGGESRYFPFVATIFDQQRQWILAGDYLAALGDIGKLGGLSASRVTACMQDEALANSIIRRGADARNNFGVNATPTFIINGEAHSGDMSFEAFEALLEPHLETG